MSQLLLLLVLPTSDALAIDLIGFGGHLTANFLLFLIADDVLAILQL